MKKIQIDSKTYDVIIVGGGPAGLFAAYYLSENSDLDVLLIEKGKNISRRNCPINEEQGCIKCKPCNILCGVGGAGLFSDGKLNYIHKLGNRWSVPAAHMLMSFLSFYCYPCSGILIHQLKNADSFCLSLLSLTLPSSNTFI